MTKFRRFALVVASAVALTTGMSAVATAAPAKSTTALRHYDPFGPGPKPTSPAPLFTGGPPTSSWQSLVHAPPFTPHHMMLLGDGNVMVQDAETSNWWKLTPDNTGSYVNGTWSQLASMPAGYAPLYYASAVLPDGRVIVEGGEYNGTSGTPAETNLGAIYDPVANSWTAVAAPAGWSQIGDAQSVMRSDGTFMMGNNFGTNAVTLNPATLTWSAASTTGKADNNSEEGWSLLPNGQLLTVDTENAQNTEKWTSGTWSSAGSTPAALPTQCAGVQFVPEIGPQLMRPNGTLLATGGTNHNAVYNTSTATWSAAPDFPTTYGVADGPAAILPNGNVLVSASPCFNAPTHYFVYDGTNLTQVADATNANIYPAYWGSMLTLPTGQVLFNNGTMSVFTDTGAYNPSWAPTITSVPSTLAPGGSYSLSGTQLNGLTEGSAFGDDAQNSTNYPLVRITNNASGHVFYARTTAATRSIAAGASSSASFTVPGNIEAGASSLVVVANGIPSAASAVSIPKPPAGYVVVHSAPVGAPAGVQSHGAVACPAGTKPVGGGVYTDSGDLAVNVNSSYPTGPRSWTGTLNNGSADATDLTVYAVCVKRPDAMFTVTSQQFSSPPHSQELGEVVCPAGVVVGGGVKSSSKNLLVNITTVVPGGTTAWDAWINNLTNKTSTFTTFAICRNKKPAGYSLHYGAAVDNPPNTDTYSDVACPGASVPLSGGVYSVGTGLSQNVNAYEPNPHGWFSYFNNADAVDNSVQTDVICAGT